VLISVTLYPSNYRAYSAISPPTILSTLHPHISPFQPIWYRIQCLHAIHYRISVGDGSRASRVVPSPTLLHPIFASNAHAELSSPRPRIPTPLPPQFRYLKSPTVVAAHRSTPTASNRSIRQSPRKRRSCSFRRRRGSRDCQSFRLTARRQDAILPRRRRA
jgi:hypothetical protein